MSYTLPAPRAMSPSLLIFVISWYLLNLLGTITIISILAVVLLRLLGLV